MRRFSTSVTLMFREFPPLARFAAVRAAGFDQVEIQVLEAAPPDLAAAARAAGVGILLLNVGMGDFLQGGAGLSGVPGREAQFLETFDQTLAAARLVGAPYVHLGPSRVPAGIPRERCLATLISNVEAAAARLEDSGVTLLIEPMNAVDVPGALLADVDEVAALLRGRLRGAASLMFDIYHVARGGQDVAEAFLRSRDVVRHVQFSDAPGRHEPGTGAIDFAALFGAIEAEGYSGWLGAEYLPSRPTIETFGWMKTLGALA
jgi:hydroxypyruvate isomerase